MHMLANAISEAKVLGKMKESSHYFTQFLDKNPLIEIRNSTLPIFPPAVQKFVIARWKGDIEVPDDMDFTRYIEALRSYGLTEMEREGFGLLCARTLPNGSYQLV
jgi:hypothetical protein